MTTKNVRLAGPAELTGAAATKYTTPAATVTIVQHIQVENPTNTPVGFTLSIGADAPGTRLYDAFPIPANEVLSLPVKWVLNPGDIIQAFASVTNTMTLTLNGQELTAG